MERLLSSSPPTPLKLHLKPSPFLSRLARIDSAKLSFPASQLPNLRRVRLVSCKHQNPSPFSSGSPSSSAPSNILPSLSSNRAGSPDVSEPKSQILNQIATRDSKQRKFQPICTLRTVLVIIPLSGGVLMQGQLEKEAKRLKIVVSEFHNFP